MGVPSAMIRFSLRISPRMAVLDLSRWNLFSILRIIMAKKKTSKLAVTTKHERPSWDEYFMNVAELIGSRGTCDRGRSGCVIVRNKQILVTGYVGAPVGLPHCDEVGHEMHTVKNADGTVSEHCVRTNHAEENAIAQAAKLGISVEGATLYCHMVPCYTCAKLLINAGIKKVISLKDYHRSTRTKEIFTQSGIKLQIMRAEIEDYKADRFAKITPNHNAC